MIRGRVGADVYSVGRDAKGKRQQVVRSLAETVANPQTVSQMRGRMIMSTIMQAVSALKPIVDHSFDNVSGVQPNLSEFIARNYALVKADVLANPASGNKFGLCAWGEKVAKQGCYIISDGQAAIPAIVAFDKATGALTIDLTGESLTMAGLKSALGIGQYGYMTIVGLNTAGAAEYARLHVNYSLADDTVITSDNLAQVFQIEGSASPVLALAGNVISATLANIAGCSALIVTRKENSGFIHSKAVLGDGDNFANPSATALPTYPVGSQKFLNGGEASFSPAPAPTPTPSVGKVLTISSASGISSVSVLANGVAVQSGDEVANGATLTFSGVVAESGYHMEARLNNSVIALTKSGTTYSGSTSMPNANATLTLTKVADSQPTPTADTLTSDGTTVSIGGSTTVSPGAQSVVVLTLAEGSSRIGKKWSYGQNQTPAVATTTLVQGANTLTIPAEYNVTDKNYQILLGSGEDASFTYEETILGVYVEGDQN